MTRPGRQIDAIERTVQKTEEWLDGFASEPSCQPRSTMFSNTRDTADLWDKRRASG
jgi:hypothetical protein